MSPKEFSDLHFFAEIYVTCRYNLNGDAPRGRNGRSKFKAAIRASIRDAARVSDDLYAEADAPMRHIALRPGKCDL